MTKKLDILIIFFILISCFFIFLVDLELVLAKDENKIYVGGNGVGNYTSIQDAIDDSNSGDTVFVYTGDYIDNIIINKSITLLGINRSNTKISGSKGIFSILIKSQEITISGFTIQNSNVGIFIPDSKFGSCNISNNIIKNNYEGIRITNSSNNNICGNTIKHNSNIGIVFYNSKNNVISDNTLINNKKAIYLGKWSSYNFISNNNLTNYTYGIHLDYSFNNIITKNIIRNGDYGTYLTSSKSNNITKNYIEYNKQSGIYLSNSDENEIFPNLFLNNNYNVNQKSKPPNIKTPGFKIILVLLMIFFVILFKKNIKIYP